MQIDLSDDIMARAQANASDIRTAVAVTLYADNRIDHLDACRLSRLSPKQFNAELLERDLPIVQYPKSSMPTREAS